MKRYDTCMFNGELDVLECRLAELDPIIDVFVIVEANRTHGGNSRKPFHYAKHKSRYEPWEDRIRYIPVNDLPADPNPWTREAAQREHIMAGLHDADSEDIILLSDVDEIPRASEVRHILPGGHTVFMQKLYCMTLNWMDPKPWYGTAASRMCEIATMNRLRENRKWAPNKIEDGGWHLSWLGGQDAMVEKFWNGCHSDDFDMTWDVKTGQFLDSQLKRMVVDHTYPVWIQDGNAPASWYSNDGRPNHAA